MSVIFLFLAGNPILCTYAPGFSGYLQLAWKNVECNSRYQLIQLPVKWKAINDIVREE